MKQAKVLSDKEIKKVIDYIDAFDRHSERNRAIILLTHYCGMRVSEVASLFVSDVVNDKGVINEVIHLTANQTKGTARQIRSGRGNNSHRHPAPESADTSRR